MAPELHPQDAAPARQLEHSDAHGSKPVDTHVSIPSSSLSPALPLSPSSPQHLLRFPLSATALDEVTKSMCDAFRGDPVLDFALRAVRPAKRAALREHFIRSLARVTAFQGLLFQVEEYASCAFWFPPGVDILTNPFKSGMWKDMLRCSPKFLKRTLVDYNIPADRAKAQYFEDKSQKSYYYLQLAGTRTERQGRGLLKHNMLPVLEMADETGQYCYLESSKESNVPIYRRFGFACCQRVPSGRQGRVCSCVLHGTTTSFSQNLRWSVCFT